MRAARQRIGVAIAAMASMAAIVLVLGSRDEAPDAPSRPDRRSARTIGDVPSVNAPPKDLKGNITSARRLRFQSRGASAATLRCRGRRSASDVQTLVTVVCTSGVSKPVGLWVTRATGKPRFLGYALANADGSARVVVEIPQGQRWTGLTLTRQAPGAGQRSKPGVALARAELTA